MRLPLSEARKNDEIISLADSQILRWIDELNGVVDADERAKEIRSEIRRIRNEPNSVKNKFSIRQLYAELDDIQFKPDYMSLIIDKEKDYHRACRGFSINGVEYERLLGTNGGIKNETIVFVSKRLAGELRRRIDNGRDLTKELVPAKLEAYKALTCSASTPVSMPNGILVVPDCETKFLDDVIYLDDERDGEPVIEYRPNTEICLNASDGCGMILPSLAQRWSQELGLDYTISGANTRFSYEKGMVFTFDFIDFAEKVAGRYIVKDAWGTERDIRGIEIVLTTSMVKLWDSYASLEDYVANSEKNGYTFCITKTCPKELESDRTLNYQFIQGYHLTDEDIDELIKPTLDEIRDILDGDPIKAVLYLKGMGLNEKNIASMTDDWTKAFLIEPSSLIKDRYVRSKIFYLVRGRIDRAKIGVLNVHGNYSIVSGDLYALCQSMFGLPVTGLLKAGEIYNQYWMDADTKEVVCFRAPMTCANNIRKVSICQTEAAAYWFRYIHTATILNAWDTITMALNGCDFDGDLVMLTDNHVLTSKHAALPALMCVQRKAKKKIVEDDDLIASNIASFGDDIGRTTNWATSMYEVRSRYGKDSDEYRTLTYRIQCAQLYQQNCIDKAKGIVCKPMPQSWHDHHAINRDVEESRQDFCHEIVADRKPYFMRYIYPALMRQYNTFVKNSNKNAIREFGLPVDRMASIPYEERTERMNEFLAFYYKSLPVGIGDCVMNRICRRLEEEFDGYLRKNKPEEKFDYTIMKSGMSYTSGQMTRLREIYRAYNHRIQDYKTYAKYERVEEDDIIRRHTELREEFVYQCSLICPDRFTLCDMLLDLCYSKSNTKGFAWEMCGREIVANLLKRNNMVISYPVMADDGEIMYHGERFTITTTRLECFDEYNPE